MIQAMDEGAATATVALLFSDIEGSTRLVQALGPEYARVLLEHRELLRAAFAAHDGEEQGTEGDSFFVTFPSASQAVSAALAGQRALAAHSWPPNGVVRVRMGVHVGEIQTVAGTIVGMVVHEAARIGAAAHGGQVLVSAAAADLAGAPPDRASLRDLGEHHLKDIAGPVRLLQLEHPELVAEFPPPRGHARGRNNLPAQTSAFIGREAEIAEVVELVGSTRLLTLTGAGGAGKSRLALRAVADLGLRFPDGIFFVDLAPISDSDDVGMQVGAALGLGNEVVDVSAAIGRRRLLLVVDNCEHVIAAVCETVETVLRACPEVVVLATSREPLGISGEVAWRVPSLDDEDAIALFLTRARAANPRFELTDANRTSVKEVCDRLDAIPLALELAAARLGSLTVEKLAERLDQRFRLLAGGARRALARQRTLQATVDWSYDLIDAPAQGVLRRLGVFVGGFTLEGAETVGTAGDLVGIDVVDVLDQLVNKSLVVAESRNGDLRYRMLETIRQYALDRLVQSGEVEAARDAHLAWARALATEAEPSTWFGGPDIRSWLDRLDAEEANLRAALDWAAEGGHGDEAAELVVQLYAWLLARGRRREALELAERVLASPVGGGSRAMAAFVAFMSLRSIMEWPTGDEVERLAAEMVTLSASPRPWLRHVADAYLALSRVRVGTVSPADALIDVDKAVAGARSANATALGLALQAQSQLRELADDPDGALEAGLEARDLSAHAGLTWLQSRVAFPLSRLAEMQHRFTQMPGADQRAWRWAEEMIAAAKETGDVEMVSHGMQALASLAAQRGEFRAAADFALGTLDSYAKTVGVQVLALAHNATAWYLLFVGDAAQADLHACQALELKPESDARRASILLTAGETACALGDTRRAWSHLREAASLASGEEALAPASRGSILQAMAAVLLRHGSAAEAAVLLGARSADASEGDEWVRGLIGEAYAERGEGLAGAVRAELGVEEYRVRFEEGAVLEFEDAIAAAEGRASEFEERSA